MLASRSYLQRVCAEIEIAFRTKLRNDTYAVYLQLKAYRDNNTFFRPRFILITVSEIGLQEFILRIFPFKCYITYISTPVSVRDFYILVYLNIYIYFIQKNPKKRLYDVSD